MATASAVLLALVALTSCLLLAVAGVSTVLRDAPPSVRLAATVCLLYGLFAWGFQILGLAGVFSLSIVTATFVFVPVALMWWKRDVIACAMSAHWTDARREMAALANGLRTHRLLLSAIAVIGLHVLVRLARALATPRLGWDDFTYHLFRAGRWVQNGGIVLEPAPDAWSYYEFFPWGGDLVWAWALIWRAGDVLVAAAGVAIWLICLLLAYGLSRRCGHDPVPSLLVAVALVLLPSQLGQIATAYVDNLQLMIMLACALLLFELLDACGDAPRSRTPRAESAVLSLLGVGCGLGMLVKLSFLPWFGVTVAAIAWDGVRRQRVGNILPFALGATIVIPNLAFNWYRRGSPFYPFRVLDSLPFNRQLASVLAGQQPDEMWDRATFALRAMVLNVAADPPFLNIGFTGFVLALLGAVGAASLWSRAPAARPYLVWAVAGAALTIGQLLAPSNASLLTSWAGVLGRFVVPNVAVILVCAARFCSPLRLFALPILAVEYFLYAPWQWPRKLQIATGLVLAASAIFGLAVAAAVRLPLRAGWTVGIATLVVSLWATGTIHDCVRYESYRLFASRGLDDFHGAEPLDAWPIWLRLEESGPARVAMAAGWDGTGHNWFRYGLLGSRLQIDVRYVSVTTDGSIVDYADGRQVAARADREAWLARLREQHIEWVALMGPRTLEHQWVEELPDVFDIEVAIDHRSSLLARVNEARLSRHLRSSL
jgi:hypothetical protein